MNTLIASSAASSASSSSSSSPCPPFASAVEFHGRKQLAWRKHHEATRPQPGRAARLSRGSSSFICRSFFDGLFAKKKRKDDDDDDGGGRHGSYHEQVSVPFPMSILQDTFLSGRELKCCYKATIDGFSAASFHERCDFKGPCVVVGETEDGLRFGGFNPEGYRSTDDYYDTLEPFLFYWPKAAGFSDDDGETIVVLKKIGGSGAALFDYARGGPQFGPDALLLGRPLAPVMGGFSGPDTNSGVGSLTHAKSRLGLSYQKRPDGKDSIFGDSRRATVREVEVFCSPAIASLY